MTGKDFTRLLDKIIPEKKVLNDIKYYIKNECHYDIDMDEPIHLSPQTKYLVQSRSFIHAKSKDLKDHLEALVYLGTEVEGDSTAPLHGMMKMYYDLEGHFLKEDRYTVWGELI